MGCNLVLVGLLIRRQQKASMAARFALWKEEVAAGSGAKKVVEADAVTDGSGPAP